MTEASAVPFSYNNISYDILVAKRSNKLLFKATDLQQVLGLKNIHPSLEHFDEDERVKLSIMTAGIQSCTMLTEIGVYRLIMRSNKNQARPMQKWVCSLVAALRA